LSSLIFAHEMYLYRCTHRILAICNRFMGLRSGLPELSDAIYHNFAGAMSLARNQLISS